MPPHVSFVALFPVSFVALFHYCYALLGRRLRVQNEDMGKIADLRPTEGRPSQQWLLGHSGAWLGANWQAVRPRWSCERARVRD